MTQYAYVTLEHYRTVEQGLDSDQTGQDNHYTRLLRHYSRLIDRMTQRRFYPRIETRYYDADENDATPDAYTLYLDDDLLEATTFTTNNGDDTIAAASYNAWPYDGPPYSELIIDANNTNSDYLLWTDTPQRAHRVLGVWGWHDDWSNAWNTGSTLNSAIVSTATTSVTVVSGAAHEAGQLIRIDDEYLLIISIATNTLTVERGYAGSTAATHDTATQIYTYEPPFEVQETLLALMQWDQAGKPGNRTITSELTGTTIETTGKYPPEVWDFTQRHKRVKVY